jgi:hypothetical protein
MKKLVLQLLHNKKEKRSLIGHVRTYSRKHVTRNIKGIAKFNVSTNYKLTRADIVDATNSRSGTTDNNFSVRIGNDRIATFLMRMHSTLPATDDDDCRRRPSRQPGEDDGFSFGYWSCGEQVGDRWYSES